jgi:putative aldouronate transport system substrate-binding protein
MKKISAKSCRFWLSGIIVFSFAGPYTRTLQDKGDVLMAEAVTCPPPQFDRVWDAGAADWLASGAQIIRDERTAQYIAP